MTSTLRGLLARQRALPLGVVFGATAVVEWALVRSVAAPLIALLFCAVFTLVVPAAWRRLHGHGAIGLALYVGVCAAVVYVFALRLPSLLEVRSYMLDPSGAPILGVLIAVGGWGLGRDLELEAQATRSAIEAEHAQLFALRAQLDPHFLFNTLNAIAEWCREDPEVAERALLELAAILRRVLEGVRAPTWPLTEELALLEALFGLYVIRDDERFHLRLEKEGALEEVTVPPMLLLPAFENAITHGPAAGHEGEVALRVSVGARVRVEIDNPGAFAGRREGGHGIALVERRLALAYGEAAEMTIRAERGRTRALMTFPREPS